MRLFAQNSEFKGLICPELRIRGWPAQKIPAAEFIPPQKSPKNCRGEWSDFVRGNRAKPPPYFSYTFRPLLYPLPGSTATGCGRAPPTQGARGRAARSNVAKWRLSHSAVPSPSRSADSHIVFNMCSAAAHVLCRGNGEFLRDAGGRNFSDFYVCPRFQAEILRKF